MVNFNRISVGNNLTKEFFTFFLKKCFLGIDFFIQFCMFYMEIANGLSANGPTNMIITNFKMADGYTA